MRRTILLVSNNPRLALKAAECAAMARFRAEVAMARDAARLPRCGWVRRWHRMRCRSPEAIAEIADALPGPLALVLGADVWGAGLCHELARLRPDLPVAPSAPPELLRQLDNKLGFTALAAGLGVRVPRSIAADDREAAIAAAVRLGWPIVLKHPLTESGHGVAIVRDRQALEAEMERQPFASGWPLQLQELVEGPVLGLNLLARDGEVLAMSTYRKVTPERFRFEPLPALAAELAPLLQATRFSGLANFDAIGTPRGPVIIEMNPRIWYNVQADALMGVNYVAAAWEAVHGVGGERPQARSGSWTMVGALANDLLRLRPAALAAGWPSWRGALLQAEESAIRLIARFIGIA